MTPLGLCIVAAILQVGGAVVSRLRKRVGDTLVYAGFAAWLGAYWWWLFG